MTGKKYLVIAVLLTFCLTTTLFLVSTTRSQTATSTGQHDPTYDPTLDVLHHGKIDMADVVAVLSAFGTTGDPTVPCNITYVSSSLAQVDVSVAWVSSSAIGGAGVGLPVSGYSRAWIWLNAPWGSSASSGTYSVTFTLTGIEWTGGPSQPSYIQTIQTTTPSQSSSITDQVVSGVITTSSSPSSVSEDSYFSIKAPYIQQIFFSISSTVSSGSAPFTLCIYLQNQ